MDVFRAAWLIARKDLTVEVRSRELAYTAVFFAVACLLIFAFAFVSGSSGLTIDNAAPGILWVTVIFAGTLALGRTFERERQSETLRALMLSPVERPAIYLGKLCSLLVMLAGIEAVLVPLVGLLFGAPLLRAPWLLLGLLGLGTLGFAAVGTLFAAMLVRASSRDVLLPVVLYPMTLPAILGGMQGTHWIFTAEPNFALAQAWLGMLLFFDAVFVTLALWTFAPVMSE
jgi:heme exporter protein CcmB